MAKSKQLPPWLKQEEAEPMEKGKKPAPKPKGKTKPKGKKGC